MANSSYWMTSYRQSNSEDFPRMACAEILKFKFGDFPICLGPTGVIIQSKRNAWIRALWETPHRFTRKTNPQVSNIKKAIFSIIFRKTECWGWCGLLSSRHSGVVEIMKIQMQDLLWANDIEVFLDVNRRVRVFGRLIQEAATFRLTWIAGICSLSQFYRFRWVALL